MKTRQFSQLIATVSISFFLLLTSLAFARMANAQLTNEIKLEQCANGEFDEAKDCSVVPPGGSIGWVSGNSNSNKSNYQLDEFIAYRYVYNDLMAGHTYCGGMSWDVTDQHKPALDYISSYSNTRTLADPTLQTFFAAGGGGNGQGRDQFDDRALIPPDPLLRSHLSGGQVFTPTIQGVPYSGTQRLGYITLWGAEFVPPQGLSETLHYGNNGMRPGDLANQGNNHQSVEWCFQVMDKGVVSGTSQVVMAWSAHIADKLCWGGIQIPNGSPYHMRGGTIYNGFSPPRTKDGDFIETDENGVVVGVKNYGNMEVQLQIEDALAITLSDFAVRSGESDPLLSLAAVTFALVATAIIIWRQRRQA